MLKITNWKDLNTLPITLILLNQLKQHLISPFHDEAQSTWAELECELWMISSLSDISRVGVDGNRITKREKNLLMPPSLKLELMKNLGIDEPNHG